jgi:5-methylcytosine-specific restriction endonuclease McrA
MATTNRTATSKWIKIRNQVRANAIDAGLTRCPLCGVGLDWEYSGRPNSAEVDHIKPYSLGGRDEIENCRIICRLDNQRLGGALNKKHPRPVVKTVELDASDIW